MRNWAGNYEYRAARIHQPRTVEELQEIVRRARKAKALGTRHSFNDVADTDHDLISTEHLNQVLAISSDSVRVQGGMPYGRLCTHLVERGLSIHNLASLPHISVAGACATATHGSGDRNGNLATAVRSIEIVRADGSLAVLERGDSDFDGAVVNLGALGVVTAVTLDTSPAFEIRQSLYEGLALDVLAEQLDEITGAAYSVSLFTDWRQPAFNQVWLKRGSGDAEVGEEFFGAVAAPDHRHPIPGVSAENCTLQMGIAGSWHERLPHFKVDFTPSNGEELQSEFLVPRQNAVAALREVEGLRERIAPLLHISEIRTMAGDELWMSPSYRQPCVGIHFTWKPLWGEVRELLPIIESRLLPLGARPHWGKLFLAGASDVAPSYPRMADFLRLREAFDPEGKFLNRYLLHALPIDAVP